MKVLATSMVALGLFAFATCYAGPPPPFDVGSIENLIAQPSTYDNHVVTFETCVLVTPHGMALFGCGESLEEPLVFFEKPEPPASDAAYKALLDAGFRATYKELVSLTVTGRFDYRPAQLPNFVVDIRDVSNIRFTQDPGPRKR